MRGDRPECPLDRSHKVHRHGSYDRYKEPESKEKEEVPRFLCVPCGHTVSVLDDELLPYRSIRVDRLECWLNWRFGGGPEPLATREVERGCADRALACFVRNSPSLIKALGQIVNHVRADAGSLWRVLRRLGDLGTILRQLQEKIKLPFQRPEKRRGLSLLGTYVCLAAWSG